jgi:hypothetical protein
MHGALGKAYGLTDFGYAQGRATMGKKRQYLKGAINGLYGHADHLFDDAEWDMIWGD